MANYQFKVLWDAESKVYCRDLIDMHISTTNSKLGASIPSFNLLPGVTCSAEACGHCLKDGCYAVKNAFRCGYNVDKNSTLSAWAENTALARYNLKLLHERLIDWFTAHHTTIKLFRIHSSGDFFSESYAFMWFDIASRFPDVRFLAFTKQFDVVRQIPFYELKNFSLVLSGWIGVVIPDDLRKYYHCAWCNDGTESRIPADAMQCPGSCEACGLCWYLNEIERDTVFTKH